MLFQPLAWSSDCRLVMVYRGVKIQPSLRGISAGGIWDAFACSSGTTGAMDKSISQADSAHQIGLKPTLQALLIVGW
jgi:hypothetical protein